jgi:SMC domain protein
MLTKFRVSNFKSFQENFEIDFTKVNKYDFNQECIRDNCINNAIVYGKNGVGKSNLGFAIFDIIEHLTDKKKGEWNYSNYINAYSESACAEFYYEFIINGQKVTYTYRKSNHKTIIYEAFWIDDAFLATIDREKSNTAVINFEGAATLNTDLEHNQEISVLKYIRNNAVLEDNVINTTFKKFFVFVEKMLFFRTLRDTSYIGLDTKEGGITEDIIKRNNVRDFETFLNRAGVECKLEVLNILGKKMLVFDFKGKKIPFWDIASTGTESLALFYVWFQDIREKGKVSFLFIDEFDAFYHFELSKLIVEELKKAGVQFVLTTHNTSIMTNDLLRPDCYFIMNKERMVSLANATDKELREAHNLEKIYKSNGFSLK